MKKQQLSEGDEVKELSDSIIVLIKGKRAEIILKAFQRIERLLVQECVFKGLTFPEE